MTKNQRRCLAAAAAVLFSTAVSTASDRKVRIIQTNSAGDNIHVIDPATNKVVQVIDGIEAAHGIDFSPDGTRVYVSNESDSTLDVFDAKSGRLASKVKLSGHPNNIAATKDGGRVVVGIAQDPGALDVIDTKTLKVAKSIPVNGRLHNVYVTPDGKHVITGSIRESMLTVIDLATEQRALSGASGYTNSLLADSNGGLQLVEDAIVWSKIKFGLKPVIAVNHITIYKRDREVGPQVLIASKQIYASHYFNAALALTAFVTVPGATQGAYLVSENRSRADGLEGPFGKIKRGVVEKKALEGLKAILEHSQMTLEGSTLGATTAELSSHHSWGQRLFGGVRPLLWLLVISALIALLVLGKRRVDSASAPKSKTLKPESAKS